MQLSAKTMRHSSPAVTGTVSEKPPARGTMIGTSTSSGRLLMVSTPEMRTISVMLGAAVMVCLAALNDTTVAGSATRRPFPNAVRACVHCATGVSRRSATEVP